MSSHVDDFNTRNKVLTAKLLRQGYKYHKIRKAFSKFYRRYFDIVSKYIICLKLTKTPRRANSFLKEWDPIKTWGVGDRKWQSCFPR